MADTRTIVVKVNGKPHTVSIETRMTLVDFLRHELNLTGTHVGCEHGVCGACTVLVNGISARACLMLAVQCDGHEVATVESLANEGKLNTLQQAFQDNHGLQCGFCTPGSASADLLSMPPTLACAYGLRTKAACSICGR